jgi:hypothetical protein
VSPAQKRTRNLHTWLFVFSLDIERKADGFGNAKRFVVGRSDQARFAFKDDLDQRTSPKSSRH